MIVTAGATNKSVYFYIVGDAGHATPGEPVTGLLFSDIETGGSASYMRQGAARVDLTLVTIASASTAHADGSFILVDDTNMPGVYRCDYPDAAFATGVDQVICQIVIASANNAVAAPVLVDITDVDLRDSVRGGMTALPNAAAAAAGGIPLSTAGGLEMDTLADWINGNRLDLILDELTVNVDAIETDTQDIQGRLPAALVNSRMDCSIDSTGMEVGAVTAVWGQICETVGSRTAQQIMSILLSAVAGVTDTGGLVLRDPAGTNIRISATINGSNERTAMSLTPSS